jgi:hypothetical protein
MKKIIPYIIVLAVGVILGLIFRPDHIREESIRVDTTFVYDTIKYSRLELAMNTYKLKVPKVNKNKYVYVPSDSVSVVYKESIKYVMMSREYFYTEADGVKIWHSGIDSTIDSLNVERKTAYITTTKTIRHKNRLSFGIEASYSTIPYIPIYLEYGRMLHKNVEIYGQIAYDLPSKTFGAGIGIKAGIQW